MLNDRLCANEKIDDYTPREPGVVCALHYAIEALSDYVDTLTDRARLKLDLNLK